MVAFRYASQEKVNIAKASAEAERKSAMNAASALKKARTGMAPDVQTAMDAMQDEIDTKMTITSVPSTPTSAGTAGQVAFDTLFIYVCVATNTWKRASWLVWV